MAAEMISVTHTRDTWLLLLGWILGKQDMEWEPSFLASAVAAIKDAVEASDGRA